MRSKHWPTLLTLLTATPLAAQRVPVSATVTVVVPAVYRIQVVPGIADAAGLPVMKVVTNVRHSAPSSKSPLLKLPPTNYRLYLEHL